ncbi:MAG TPA: bi-domain-containing oxidoreductase, partial [Nitrospiraceae bacterium]|nr:bi-domain-containing oxidoreductase [Nitrospiraceae bacterium]
AALGYSGAGIVVEKHPTVTDVEVGDRVAYGGEGTGHGETILAGQNLIAEVSESVPFQHAAFTTLGSIAMNAVRTAEIGLGDTVAVVGVGLVGQLICQLVKLQGGVPLAIDLKPDRLEVARQLGAEHVLLGDSSLLEAVKAVTGGKGVDAVIVAAAAKSSAPVEHAIRIVRDRGRLVIVGAVQINLPYGEMYIKELRVFMSRAYGPGSYDPQYEKQGQDYPYAYVRWTEKRNMEEFVRLLAAGRIDVRPLITHEFRLDQAADAYETIMNPSSQSLAVLLRYPAHDSDSVVAGYKPQRKMPVTTERTGQSQLRVAVLGAGNLARWEHLPTVKKLSGVALRAVCSASGVRGMSYAKRFGAEYCYTDYQEMLADPAIDIVMILTRHEHHAAQALAALRAGKHVFLEKPMAITEKECQALYHESQRSGKQLTVGFNRRFAPFYVEQKRLVSRRKSPAVINCRINSPGLSGGFWAADPALGGALVGEGCHFVDLMYWLLDSEPVTVSGFSLPTGHQEPIGENNIVASFHFADGSIGNLTYCTVGSKTSGGERVEVFTSGVAVTVEDFKTLRTLAGGRSSRSQWWPDKGFAAQLESFFSRIRDGKPAEVTVVDGARATIGCLRILESAQKHGPRAIGLEDSLHA